MKNISLSVVLLWIMVACTTVEEHYITETVEPYTLTRECTAEHWIKCPPAPTDPQSSIYTFFYCDFEIPELTSYVLENGVTAAYFVYWEENRMILTPLPLDDFYMQDYFLWTEQATCEFSPGWVRFIIKYSDFELNVRPPKYTFLIKLMW